MKHKRLIGFFFAIALGLAVGLFFGWLVDPPRAKNTVISSLRADYQADYVLMVAWAYPETADIPAAIEQLKELDANDPLRAVRNAFVTAQQLGYSQIDLQSIADLGLRLEAWLGAK